MFQIALNFDLILKGRGKNFFFWGGGGEVRGGVGRLSWMLSIQNTEF